MLVAGHMTKPMNMPVRVTLKYNAPRLKGLSFTLIYYWPAYT